MKKQKPFKSLCKVCIGTYFNHKALGACLTFYNLLVIRMKIQNYAVNICPAFSINMYSIIFCMKSSMLLERIWQDMIDSDKIVPWHGGLNVFHMEKG